MAAPRKRRGGGDPPLPPVPPIDGLIPASATETVALSWVWPGAIPTSTIVLVEGRKSVGKSSVLAAIAASWTGGPPLPGWTGPRAGRVLWVASEDSWGGVVVPRLRAAAANLDCVYQHLLPVPGQQGRRPRIPEDLGAMEDMIRGARISLVILDPYISLAPAGLDVRVEQQARAYLEPLADLCFRHDVTALLSRHIRKGAGGDARESGMGSVAIGNVARSILRCDEHPHTPGDYLLSVVACNYGRRRATQVYRIVDGPGDYPQIEWRGDCDLDADGIAEGRGSAAERDEWRDADRVLCTMIGTSRIMVSLLESAAAQAGVTPRMLRRAKERLRVPSHFRSHPQPGCWEWGPPPGGWPPALLEACGIGTPIRPLAPGAAGASGPLDPTPPPAAQTPPHARGRQGVPPPDPDTPEVVDVQS